MSEAMSPSSRPHLVPSLSFGPVHGVRPAVQAGSHFEGLDEFCCTDATGTLRHDARETHRPLHVDLPTDNRIIFIAGRVGW